MIDILVPVLSRPQNAQPVAESVRATCEARIIFLCSPEDEDEIAACLRTGEEVIVMDTPAGSGDFARKINRGFREGESEFVFQGADDIRFHPGWLEHALAVAAKGLGVIGTNDLGNPLVKRGGHSTHSLIRRSYINHFGGTLDGSGLVFSEAYDHQWCDTEFVLTARKRRQWGFSKLSIVEHLHPHWGKAPMDATYEKSLRATTEDGILYRQRMKMLGTLK